MILGGMGIMFTGNPSGGLGLFALGVILGGVNKLVFRVRTKQLDIDTKEAVRDKIGLVCPNCGQRQNEGSKFCNNCGRKL